jgi:FkbM family methyltransferase
MSQMLKLIYRAVRSGVLQLIGTQARLPVSRHNFPLVRLGNSYGGWWIADFPELHGSTIISAGLGEDASFDIAFADRYGARVIMVDPTPRAVAYFDKIRRPAFELCDHALWDRTERLKFYAPKNPAHVSYSVVNFQNNYTTNTAAIEVEAITIDALTGKHGIPALIKLDIEGAEVEVTHDMMRKKIFPRQILIEYDDMQMPSRRSRERVEHVHAALIVNGYTLIRRDGYDCLYVRRETTAAVM